MNSSVLRLLLIRLPLFLLPPALVLAPPAWVLAVSGEWSDPVTMARQQSALPSAGILYGPAYSSEHRVYKAAGAKARASAVLVLGSSHMMQVRSSFFKDENAYNAAIGGMRIEDLRLFLKRIPQESQPEIIFLGVDPFFSLAEPWARLETAYGSASATVLDRAFEVTLSHWMKVYRDLFSGKVDPRIFGSAAPGFRPVGLHAWVKGEGFRADGSYQNAAPPGPPPSGAGEASHANLVEGRTFTGGAVPAALTDFLDACRSRGIDVVGFFPPMRRLPLRRLSEMPETRTYLAEAGRGLTESFAARGHRFYDLSDAAALGAEDAEAYDDFHFSTAAFAKLFAKLAELDERSAAYLRRV